jgi:hypothetical protein
MSCLPANIVGLSFIILIIFDIIQSNWTDLPYHAAIGIGVTALYSILCMLIGETISWAILFVPAVFLIAFVFASWLLQHHLQKQNCCMTCKGSKVTTPASTSGIINLPSILTDLFGSGTQTSTPATKKCNPPKV